MASRRILLFNYDDSIGEVVHVCLRYLAGWDVVSVGKHETDSDVAISPLPDAVLLDLVLPKLDQLEFIHRQCLRRLTILHGSKSVPIVLLIDQANWFSAAQLRSLGIAGAIAKPFDPTRLPLQIAQILNWEVATTTPLVQSAVRC